MSKSKNRKRSLPPWISNQDADGDKMPTSAWKTFNPTKAKTPTKPNSNAASSSVPLKPVYIMSFEELKECARRYLAEKSNKANSNSDLGGRDTSHGGCASPLWRRSISQSSPRGIYTSVQLRYKI